jgi:YgiT-type zinc finger domain-containing protein
MIVSKCAICGGNVEERAVTEDMRVGNDFVVIEDVRVGVCVECEERYYPPGVVDRLRNIDKRMMDRNILRKLDVIGNTYRLRYDLVI